MVAGSAKPLEDAVRIAHTQLIYWVMKSGLSLTDSYQLVSQAATTRIGNVVDLNDTAVSKIAKRYLPAYDWMMGTHQKMREIGQRIENS